MKKKIMMVLALAIILNVQLLGNQAIAKNIGQETAQQYSAYYMSMLTGKEVMMDQVWLEYQFMNEELNVPAAYIFNVENLGYVIISGSDLWYPILGYSTEGLCVSENMPPSFKEYFDGMCDYIRYAQHTGKALIKDVESEWDELKYRKLPEMYKMKSGEYLMSSVWGQGGLTYPTYNMYCPHKEVNGVENYALTGCIATAMSQIMYYWKYPEEPKRDYMGYTCYLNQEYYDYIDIDLRDVRYDFSLMKDSIDNGCTQESIEAMALLCYHAGVSVKMDYGFNWSGAFSNRVKGAMNDIFLYDTSAVYLERTKTIDDDAPEMFTNDEWEAMMSEEIANGRPIYYSGYTDCPAGRYYGGHAFVCDGKDAITGKFHMNWGWDGYGNTWCDVRNNDVSVDASNYRYHQEMVIHIQPVVEPEVGVEGVESSLMPAYPNPAANVIYIPYNYDGDGNGEMYIYGVDGRVVDVIAIEPGEHEVSVDVSKYPRGLYLYKLGAYSRKFIVE